MTSEAYYSFAEVARILGTTRQNISQRVLRGSIPYIVDEDGKGVPEEWVHETLRLRARNVNGRTDD